MNGRTATFLTFAIAAVFAAITGVILLAVL